VHCEQLSVSGALIVTVHAIGVYIIDVYIDIFIDVYIDVFMKNNVILLVDQSNTKLGYANIFLIHRNVNCFVFASF